MISRNLLPGWLRKAVRVTNFVKSLGPIKWVADVGVVVVLCIIVLVLVACSGACGTIRVTNFVKSLGPIQWVVDVVGVVVFVFIFSFLSALRSNGPSDFTEFVTRMASKSRPGNEFREIT